MAILMNKKNAITVVLLLSFWGLYAQKSCDAQRVNVHFLETSLKDVLKEISAKYNIKFSYGNNYLDLTMKISFHSEGKTLKETLGLLFKSNGIVYARIGSQLVLKPSKKKKRKERKKRRKRREKKREERDKEILERGTLFDFDLHSELIENTVPIEVKSIERQYLSVNKIEPLVIDSIVGSVRYEDSLQAEPANYVPPMEYTKGKTRALQLSLSPFLGTNGRHLSISNAFSMNILWGVNGGLKGMEFGIIGNTIVRNATGLQAAGAMNTVGGRFIGLQASGVINITKGNVLGMQVCGVFNLGREIYGTQITSVLNISQTLIGVQISGFSNWATNVYGLQVSGVFNFANGKLFGSQIAGLGNIAWGGKSALQFAGVFNMSAKTQFQAAAVFNTAREVEGAQIGVLNVARRVKGVQVGIVNVTRSLMGGQVGIINVSKNSKGVMIGIINVVDSMKGIPLGLINIVKTNGYNRIEMFASETMYINFGGKFGPRHLYHIVQLGWKTNADNTYSWLAGLGFGSMFYLDKRKKMHLNLELIASHVHETTVWNSDLNLLNQFRTTVDFNVLGKMSIFLGPVFNLQLSNLYDNKNKVYGSKIMPYTLYDKTDNQLNLKMWIGVVGGVRF